MSETNQEYLERAGNSAEPPELTEMQQLLKEVRSNRIATQVIAWVICVIVAINLIVGWVMAAQLVHLVDLVNQPTY
jgi:hypothetical protein